jgi:hypothetical protein
MFPVHSCTKCGRVFGSAAGLAMHYDVVHPAAHALSPFGGRSADDLEPPFPRAAGRWVPFEEFTNEKSFGMFWCSDCEQHWISAHAFRSRPNKQQCKLCGEYHSPGFMWVNAESDHDSDASSDRPGKPHLAVLCQRCQSGWPCTKARSYGSDFT